MKKTVRITETELKNIITSVLNEAKYGGVEFHGNNPEDWYAMRNLRVHSPVDMKDYGKAARNIQNAHDMFNGSEDEVEDWVNNNLNAGWDKANQALNGAEKIKMQKGVRLLQQLVYNHQTFYTKRWQQNNYYPITRWEYNEANGDYTVTWGEHTKRVPLDKVVSRATTLDDLLTPQQFSDEHQYEEIGVETYPIYHALDQERLNEAVSRAIQKYLK